MPVYFTENDAFFSANFYAYHYDSRNRNIEKKIPGKGWEYMVYNTLDQVIFTQDANQVTRQEDGFIKYDAIGRVIMTGIEGGHGETRANLQANVNNQLANMATNGVTLWETPSAGAENGYTNTSIPSGPNAVPLVINYYDNYNFPSGSPSYPYVANGQITNMPAAASQMTTGLLTATSVAVLNTISSDPPDMLWTVHYYDDLGRAIQTNAQHYLGGTLNNGNYDQVSNGYDFTNEVTQTIRVHYNTGSSNPAVTIANNYTYDHMGRKLRIYEQINGGTNVLLSKTDYNEIGQVLGKHLHSTNGGSSFLQDIAYAYNERGWLAKINDPINDPATARASNKLFAEQLNYNLTQYGAQPQFNGNIAEQVYNGQNSQLQNVVYAYDSMNRLTRGTSSAGFSEAPISYDNMGNIVSLTRNNFGTLGYGYSGNQLTSITGFKSGSYGYDPNGNVQTENTSLNGTATNNTYTYNLLNLPQTITGTVNLSYVYDAAGTKLRKISNGSPTDYIGGIQYKTDAVTIDFIQTEEGRAINLGGSYNYEYTLTDHLGNNRVTFDMVNGKVGEDEYYPFGLNAHLQVNAGNNYLYNKKELQPELGQYDYGARFYDPVIARWNTVDPSAENYESTSSYAYVLNNPINLGDIDGRDTGKVTMLKEVFIHATKPAPKPTIIIDPDEVLKPHPVFPPPPAWLMPVATFIFVILPANYDDHSENDALEARHRLNGPKRYRDKHGNLTNGKYTVSKEAMKKHVFGQQGRSVFYPGIDAEELVLRAAEHADAVGLWNNDKAKVFVENTGIGTTGLNLPSNVVNVYRNSNGFIHGSPGN